MGEADHVGFWPAEEIGDERIAAAGDLRGFESPQGDAFHECARIADFHPIREDGDADFVGVVVIAVAEGVDDGFAEFLAVDFRDIDADQSVEPHADADVLEDVFFSFFDGFGFLHGNGVRKSWSCDWDGGEQFSGGGEAGFGVEGIVQTDDVQEMRPTQFCHQ